MAHVDHGKTTLVDAMLRQSGALTHRGDDAVEPLLQVLVEDDRLTRAVSFGRDFSRWRHLIGVHEAAFAALIEIIQASTFIEGRPDLESDAGRRELAAAIRAYLAENRGLSPEDRWFRR